jgi:uncharacterized protein YcbK (DUF882 family)
MINDFQLSKDFNLKEFECTHPDHHHVMVDSVLVEKLQKLRDRLRLPLSIISAYRCPERNKQVGGAKNSYHAQGMAVDISLHNQILDTEIISSLARKIGFNGIGLYDDFMHLDVRPGNFTSWDKRSFSNGG